MTRERAIYLINYLVRKFNIGADIGSMAAATRLVVPVPQAVPVPSMAAPS